MKIECSVFVLLAALQQRRADWDRSGPNFALKGYPILLAAAAKAADWL
jgi:hypothetical protein